MNTNINTNMNKYLLHEGYLLRKDMFKNSQLTDIKKELTKTPKVLPTYSMFKKQTEIRLYKETVNYLIIPRFYGISKFGNPIKEILSIGEEMLSDISFTYTLLPHQHEATSKTLRVLEKFNGGILSLPCGYGKTGISIYLAIHLKRKTGVIVNKECLADQWIDAINKFTNNKARIGRIQQDIYDIKDKDFVICMVHTFVKREYPIKDIQTFGMFIIDECHHMGSEMFSQALPKLGCKYLLGLSDTPKRKDGLSDVFHYYLGNLCHSEKRSGNNNVIVKRIVTKSQDKDYDTLITSNGTKNTAGMITNISKFTKRNILIIEIIKSLMCGESNKITNRKILLLSERREHLETLYELLSISNIKTFTNNSMRPITFGYYYGNNGTNKKEHKQLLLESSKCDVILGTHQLASEGLDIPDLNTEIIATPRADVEQAVGRILRKFHKILPFVVDIVDDCGNFKNQSYIRNKLYKSEDYVIKTLNIDLDKNNDIDKINIFINNEKDIILLNNCLI